MLLGYAITAAVLASFLGLIGFAIVGRKELAQLLRERISLKSLLALVVIVSLFVSFSAIFIPSVEQLYFDENIYQGIAINILAHGNALWCQFGTGYLRACYVNQVYHDPVGWSVFIAMAFAVFGIGVATSHALELLTGALAIVGVFLLSSVLFERKRLAVFSTVAFAAMPLLYVWARTQADIDLPFMMLAIFAFFFFVVFAKRRSFNTLAMFAFSLALVAYMRIEAMLLVIVFAALLVAFGDSGMREEIKRNAAEARRVLSENVKVIMLLIAFILLITPELYYISMEASSPDYGQPTGQAVLSLANFDANIKINAEFVLGIFSGMNTVASYPLVFSSTIMVLAVLGTVLFAFDKRYGNRFGILAMLWLWFAAYFVFYTAFYAGAATYGVDSRFMLQLMPPLCLLGALAAFELGSEAQALLQRGSEAATNAGAAAFWVVAAGVIVVALLYPFAALEPVFTLAPNQMPQQSVILPATTFFYNSYKAVPNDCLVFSFTPDIWYEVNVSSAQIGYANGAGGGIGESIDNYSCKVVDSGYWCVVPPYRNTTCANLAGRYSKQVLATEPAGNGYNTSFYKILNYP
jgi:MFS family permease